MVFVASAGLSGLLLSVAWTFHDGPPWWPAIVGLSSLTFSLVAHALLRRFETRHGRPVPDASGASAIADGHTRAAAMRLLGQEVEGRPEPPAPAPLSAWPAPYRPPRPLRQPGPLVWYADTH
ncbi:hypothetical protein [Methylobacterium oryzihabitans]|uniref:Uncharacterized protein n=1 Tax=Methylobacterium oryzihabitans TaxID=2499852 RepID=A0A3S2W6U1_9HYPH|nr:hypothetical protein [Methylobacterium oryzihabitans]RVU15163.1 hypothetical protein EOE48_20340 [Methylobacterium oryzihabitans]